MKSILIILTTLLVLSVPGRGQELPVFKEEQLLQIVRDYHPTSVQAGLLLELGTKNVGVARGAFDPNINGSIDQKYFDDKNYYSLIGAGLNIPTWFGIELNAGIQQNEGVFLNPQNNVPVDGLWKAGISVPIGKGMFIDERRAALRQAELFSQSTVAEQKVILNDLFYDALSSYWKWVEIYNQLQVYEESLQLANTRFIAVRQSYVFGDIAAIDTLEAFIQVQNREAARNNYSLLYLNAGLELSNYLWFENSIPLEISDSIQAPSFESINLPQAFTLDSLEKIVALISTNHPQLQLQDFQIASLEIDKRFKSELLKPQLDLNYNALSEEIRIEESTEPVLSNYTWGASFSMPIFLRKERAELAIAKIKIRDKQLDRSNYLLQLQNNVRSSYNQIIVLNQQVNLFNSVVKNYSDLLDGERQKFSAGESSLFLINSREVQFINSQLKLISLISKSSLSRSAIRRAAGDLHKVPLP